jgi:hypothetical protein
MISRRRGFLIRAYSPSTALVTSFSLPMIILLAPQSVSSLGGAV